MKKRIKNKIRKKKEKDLALEGLYVDYSIFVPKPYRQLKLTGIAQSVGSSGGSSYFMVIT